MIEYKFAISCPQCRIINHGDDIEFCVLHQAAKEMQHAFMLLLNDLEIQRKMKENTNIFILENYEVSGSLERAKDVLKRVGRT